MNITVLIVDDHTIFRQAIRGLLENESDIKVLGEACNGMDAVRLAGELHPDIIIMDIVMPVLNGIEATRKILFENRDIRVLALSMETDMRLIVEVFESGASGYVQKESIFTELADAIRTVFTRETYISPIKSDLIIKDYLKRIHDELSLPHNSLTILEEEIGQLIADGKNAKEIAGIFNISIKTVEVHRHSIMNKLNLYSIAELTKYAVREGSTSIRL